MPATHTNVYCPYKCVLLRVVDDEIDGGDDNDNDDGGDIDHHGYNCEGIADDHAGGDDSADGCNNDAGN